MPDQPIVDNMNKTAPAALLAFTAHLGALPIAVVDKFVADRLHF
jgi:hypothetical protein